MKLLFAVGAGILNFSPFSDALNAEYVAAGLDFSLFVNKFFCAYSALGNLFELKTKQFKL